MSHITDIETEKIGVHRVTVTGHVEPVFVDASLLGQDWDDAVNAQVARLDADKVAFDALIAAGPPAVPAIPQSILDKIGTDV